MKTPLCILLAAFFVVHAAPAFLGDDKVQVAKEYGAVRRTGATSATVVYERQGYQVLVEFDNAVSVAEGWSKLNQSQFTDQKLQALLKVQAGNKSWTELPIQHGERRWTRTGATASYAAVGAVPTFAVAQVLPKHLSSALATARALLTSPTSPSPSSIAKSPEELLIEVDRFTGKQTIRLAAGIKVTADMKCNFVAVVPEGAKQRTDVVIMLRFVRSGHSWQFLDYHPLKMLIDGARVALAEPSHHGDVMEEGGVLEQMTVVINAKTFVSIANGNLVECRLGTTEFALPYGDRAGMRKFADSLSGFGDPPSSVPSTPPAVP